MYSASNYWRTMPSVSSWQEALSNTAHQREVADLKAAGLNPMLSVSGSGASTPSGSSDDFLSGYLGKMMNIMGSSITSSSKSLDKAVSSLSKSLDKSLKTLSRDFSSGNITDGDRLRAAAEDEEGAIQWIYDHFHKDKPRNMREQGQNAVLDALVDFVNNDVVQEQGRQGRLTSQGNAQRYYNNTGQSSTTAPFTDKSPFGRALARTFEAFGSYT